MSLLADHSPLPEHLYVHVPFCAHRCGYCDFVTTSHQPEIHDRYVMALVCELQTKMNGHDGHRFHTVYVGGGTPTLLNNDALQRLIGTLGSHLAPGGEFTIECNPETVTPDLAAILVGKGIGGRNGSAHGVSRVSLGVQSMDRTTLEVLERNATPEIVRGAVHILRDAGLENLSTDMIWSIPGQSLEMQRADIEALLTLEPNHISAYELEFKPGTKITHKYQLAPAAKVDEFDAEAMYRQLVDVLEGAGFHWYETANFCRDGAVSAHNVAYWQQRDYLGIGVGAVGTRGGVRTSNLPNLPRYLAAIESGDEPPQRSETLDEYTQRTERIMLALRLDEWCEITSDADAKLLDAEGLERCTAAGLLLAEGSRIRLTPGGRMMLNTVLTQILL